MRIKSFEVSVHRLFHRYLIIPGFGGREKREREINGTTTERERKITIKTFISRRLMK